MTTLPSQPSSLPPAQEPQSTTGPVSSPHPSSAGYAQYPAPSMPPRGYGYAPPPPPPMVPPGNAKASKPTITIGKLSIFSMALSLVFFGALTFLGGFFFGIGMGGSGGHAPSSAPQYATVMPPGSFSQQQGAPSRVSELAHLAGTAAAGAVAAFQPSSVPAFLAPLADEARRDASQAAREETQQTAQTLLSSPEPSLPKTGPYAVQLGTFAAKENAKELQARLQALNYPTDVREEKSSQSTVYHVHSGRYTSYELASHAAKQFKNNNIPGAIVVKVPATDNTKAGL